MTAPTLITNDPTSVTASTAVVSGAVLTSGGTLDAQGFVYGQSINPTIADDLILNFPLGVGAFSNNLSGLSASTTYYIRAYATNTLAETGYGNNVILQTLSGSSASDTLTNNRFGTHFGQYAALNLLRQFGESALYTPSGGVGRSITVMVERREPQIIAEVGDVPSQSMIVRALNNPSTGISSEEIDTGGDKIAVPLRIGEAFKTLSIVTVLSDTAAFTRFLVQ